jgi:hypothetical protein
MRPYDTISTLLIVAAFIAVAGPAQAMYHPGQGRFMQRDPAGYVDGMSAYQYARSRPGGATDPRGLWSQADHRALTEAALLSSIDMPDDCAKWILQRLADASSHMDTRTTWVSTGHWGDYEAHYCMWPGQNPQKADGKYGEFLGSHDAAFSTAIQSQRPTAKDCTNAMDALGHLVHAWEDFYVHVVRFTPQAGPVWSEPPPGISPDARDLDFYKPAVYPDEHGDELRLRDAPPVLKDAVVDFVRRQFQDYLSTWISKCHCHCPQ